MICTKYVEWLVLRWMIWNALHDLCSVGLFVQRWIIYSTVLNYLYYVEWFVLRWMICTTLNDFLLPCKICATSKDLYSVDRFVLRWMIRSAMDDLYNVESFGLRWIIEYRLFNECQVCLLEKILCLLEKILWKNIWVDFFLIWKYQKKYFRLYPTNWS